MGYSGARPVAYEPTTKGVKFKTSGVATLYNDKGYEIADVENFLNEARAAGAEDDDKVDIYVRRQFCGTRPVDTYGFRVNLPTSLDFYRPRHVLTVPVVLGTLMWSFYARRVGITLLLIGFITGTLLF